MTPITSFADLSAHLLGHPSRRKRVAVAYPHDDHTREAVEAALQEGFADFILVGRTDELRQLPFVTANLGRVTLEQSDTPEDAARRAVALVRGGSADVLMKGMMNTDVLLHAVLDKQLGLLPPGGVLSHITASEIPGHGRLLFFADAAVIPFPTLAQRTAMLAEMTATIRSFGIAQPRIALIHCTEQTSPRFPVTLDYAELRRLAAEGEFGAATVDGPMDVRCACEPGAAAVKGIVSPVAGCADGLLMPDIEAANVFYKTVTTFAGAINAGMLMGTTAPVVLPSRGDSPRGKLYSLAMACLKTLSSN